jgi:hypothetical protein
MKCKPFIDNLDIIDESPHVLAFVAEEVVKEDAEAADN